MKQLFKLIFPLLILIFSLVRFYQLGKLPQSLNRDEAALGYNAYLLKEQAVDEWGRGWALTLESFGDQKLIGYPALLVGFFTFLGESDWAVRLPSALMGLLLLVVSWGWGRELKFKEQVNKLFLLLVITTPVFFFYSRVAYEANVALVYLLAGILLLIASPSGRLWKNLKNGVGAGLIFLAAITYNTPLLLLPFLLPLLYFANNRTKEKLIINSGIVLLIFLAVGANLWPVLSQKSGITIFTDMTVWTNWMNFREGLPTYLQPILGSKYLYWLGLMAKNTLASFAPKFLIFSGGNHPWHQLPHWGHLIWTSYLLGIYGSYKLVKQFLTSRGSSFSRSLKIRLGLLVTLLLSLAPAVVTVDAPHATRSLLFFYIWLIMATIGIEYLLKQKNGPKLVWTLMTFQVAIFSLYLYQYFTQYPKYQAELYQTGFKPVIDQLDHDYPNQPIAVVDQGGYQYILLAWYQKTDPKTYLSTNVRQLPNSIGLRYGERVGRYHFIANVSDRSAKEKIVLIWDNKLKQWKILKF